MSEATKAAQGPYRLTDEGASGDVLGCREILDASGEVIAATAGMSDDDEDLANARLMAASWAMREALELADAWLEAAEQASKIGGTELHVDPAKIRAALKAANGE
jgi:hypothetical protein